MNMYTRSQADKWVGLLGGVDILPREGRRLRGGEKIMASSDREVLKEGFLVKKVGQMAAVYAGNCMHKISCSMEYY